MAIKVLSTERIIGESAFGPANAWWRKNLIHKNTFLECLMPPLQDFMKARASSAPPPCRRAHASDADIYPPAWAIPRSGSPSCSSIVSSGTPSSWPLHSQRGHAPATCEQMITHKRGPSSTSIASVSTEVSGGGTPILSTVLPASDFDSGYGTPILTSVFPAHGFDSVLVGGGDYGGGVYGSMSEVTTATKKGSLMAHEQGVCKPCVFHSRPRGCDDGDECGFCHYPHEQAEAGSRGSRKWRPCKGKRDRYHKLMARLEEAVRADPDNFCLERVQLPALVTSRPFMMRKVGMVADNLVRAAQAGLPVEAGASLALLTSGE